MMYAFEMTSWGSSNVFGQKRPTTVSKETYYREAQTSSGAKYYIILYYIIII